MDIEKYRTFITCSECKTYGEAAAKLSSTIATVSRHISELENQFGVTLFERNVNGLVLTEEGQKCLEAMKGIVYRYDQLMKVVDLPEDGPVMVAYNPPISVYHIREGLNAFSAAHPEIEVSYTDEDIIIPKLFTHHYEIGILNRMFGGYEDHAGIRFPIGQMGILVDAEHALASQEKVTSDQLKGQKILSTSRANDKYWNNVLLESHGFKLNISYTMAREDVLVESVKREKLPALFNSSLYEAFRYPGTIFIPFDEPITTYASLLKLRAVSLSPKAEVFQRFINDWILNNIPGSSLF